MSPELRGLLERGAPPPLRDLDVEAVSARGRQWRRRRAASVGFAVVAVLALLAVPLSRWLTAQPDVVLTRPSLTLDETLAMDLDRALTESARAYRLTGASAAVVFPDGEVWTGQSGAAAPSSSQAVTADTRFALDHLGELITAGVIADLVADGSLSLDDPVSGWLPHLDVGAVTVRQLLYHVSGLPDVASDAEWAAAVEADPLRRWTFDDLSAYIKPPGERPGTTMRYSQADYLLLGRVAELAGGASLGTLARDRLLGPLGADSVVVQSEQPPEGPIARGSGLPQNVSMDDPLIPFTSWATAAWPWSGMAGTAADAARALHAILRGELPSGADASILLDWSFLDGVEPAVGRHAGQRHAVAGLVSYVLGGHEVWVADTGPTPGFIGAVAHVADVTIVALANGGYADDDVSAPDPVRALLAAVVDALPEDVARGGQGTSDVLLWDRDDGVVTRVSDAPGLNYPLAWSPQGDRLLVQSDRDGNWELYLEGLDGSRAVRLTDTAASEGVGGFSPDGGTVVFQSDRDGDFDVFTTTTVGRDVVQLTGRDDDHIQDWLPAWSPDGSHIAFVRGRGAPTSDPSTDRNDLWVMAADGTQQRLVARGSPSLLLPKWSPDGTALLAYTADGQLVRVDVSTGRTARIDVGTLPATQPAWSADGSRIAFAAGEAGARDVWTAASDGTDARRLLTTADDESLPVWAPDGDRIAFSSGQPR